MATHYEIAPGVRRRWRCGGMHATPTARLQWSFARWLQRTQRHDRNSRSTESGIGGSFLARPDWRQLWVSDMAKANFEGDRQLRINWLPDMSR
jgi:hypothetical protein